jgi:hypothetical protein
MVLCRPRKWLDENPGHRCIASSSPAAHSVRDGERSGSAADADRDPASLRKPEAC